MNVLFLTISGMPTYERHDIYADVLHALHDNGHNVYSISANQKRNGKPTSLTDDHGIKALRVQTGNITQCGKIEKGISTIMIEYQYIAAIKKYLSDVKFDLVLYATPPITLAGVVKFVKDRDNAKSYLMLKDIFPQNAVDLGMMAKSGLRGLIYKYFRREEKRLYAVSDKIGCMSPANVEYILRENPEIEKGKVEVFPNCLDPLDLRVSEEQRIAIRKKYNIPLDKVVFVYGGNLGRPQGIPFIIECFRKVQDNEDAYFLVVGGGTEFTSLEKFVTEENPRNVSLMNRIPKEDYDILVGACDVGLIFLDHRFKIPNFPSRLLSYMQAGLPVLAATDSNTDIGKIAVEGDFGWWCESDDVETFSYVIQKAVISNRLKIGENSYKYLQEEFNVKDNIDKIEQFVYGENKK